jgi:hypothetical protein
MAGGTGGRQSGGNVRVYKFYDTHTCMFASPAAVNWTEPQRTHLNNQIN